MWRNRRFVHVPAADFANNVYEVPGPGVRPCAPTCVRTPPGDARYARRVGGRACAAPPDAGQRPAHARTGDRMALPSTTHPRGAHTTGPARTAIGALLALVLAVTGAVLGALPAKAADTASIVGQVYVKKVGGQPVPADYAYGYLYKYDGENFWSYRRSEDEPGWSAEDGMFDITGLPAGRYKLEINSAGTWDDDTRYQRE